MANIEIENLSKLVADSGKIFLTSDAEDSLVQLLEIQKQVEDAIDEAKATLEKAALATDPNFSSIQSDKVKVFYRQYGARYKIDESLIEEMPAEFYQTKTNYSPNVEAIETWIEEHKGMPYGIIEVDRPKSLSFSLKNGGKDNE